MVFVWIFHLLAFLSIYIFIYTLYISYIYHIYIYISLYIIRLNVDEGKTSSWGLFTDAKVLRNELLQDYDKDIPAEPSERLMNSLEKEILFLQEELRSKNKLISLLMDQLSKNSYKISSCQQ